MSEQDTSLVPGKSHYAARYVRGGRLFSYAHQMNAVLEHEPKTVLEIGPGPGMVTAALRAIGIAVTTVDIQPELEPDVVASVTNLPFDDDLFDVAMCCQVLEHLPFDQFAPAMTELSRVSRQAVVISLPDCTPFYGLWTRLPILGVTGVAGSRNQDPGTEWKHRKFETDGHYWEIGYREVTLRRLLDTLRNAGFADVKSWRVRENSYHRFVVCRN